MLTSFSFSFLFHGRLHKWVYINTRADNGHVHREDEEHEGNCVECDGGQGGHADCTKGSICLIFTFNQFKFDSGVHQMCST